MAEALVINPAINGLLLLQTASAKNCLLAGANDNLLQIEGLQTGLDHTYINDATVTVVVKDDTEEVLTGMMFPAPLDYIAESNGCYRVMLSNLINLEADRYYTLLVEADSNGVMASWERCIKAEVRR